MRMKWGLLLVLLTTAAQCNAYTIKGSIEHAEQMPEMPTELRAGADYAAVSGSNNRWVMIPGWLAGTWQVKEETAVYLRDYLTGRVQQPNHTFRARHQFYYGSQKDRNGNPWHFNGVPYESHAKLAEYEEHHKVQSKDFPKVGQNEVRFRTIVSVVRTRPGSGHIESSFQQESITCYKPLTDDTIELTSSTKVFDASGRPQKEVVNVANIRRVKPYIQYDNKDGRDLAALFRNYLIEKNLTYLLP